MKTVIWIEVNTLNRGVSRPMPEVEARELARKMRIEYGDKKLVFIGNEKGDIDAAET